MNIIYLADLLRCELHPATQVIPFFPSYWIRTTITTNGEANIVCSRPAVPGIGQPGVGAAKNSQLMQELRISVIGGVHTTRPRQMHPCQSTVWAR